MLYGQIDASARTSRAHAEVLGNMTNIKAAEQLGIQHQEMRLIYSNKDKRWKVSNTCDTMKVEAAVLQIFHDDGWAGYPSEGGLILNSIKAASFKPLLKRDKMVYIEALYYINYELRNKDVTFDEYEYDDLIENIRSSNIAQFSKNIEIMFDNSISGSNVRDIFPDLQPQIMVEFYLHIGNERLARIAEIFAKDPYEYRKGWPDLTLWKPGSEQIIFREVKAPRDKIRPSQKKVIQDILLPLGYDVGIIDVKRHS